MFSLILTTCLGMTGFCVVEASPISYVTLERCQQQAAIIAGMTKAAFVPGGYPMAQILTVECSAMLGEVTTITIEIGGI